MIEQLEMVVAGEDSPHIEDEDAVPEAGEKQRRQLGEKIVESRDMDHVENTEQPEVIEQAGTRLYYLQPDGSYKLDGDGRSEGVCLEDIPDGAEIAKAKADEDPCWAGYHMVGTKTVDGRTVPNCVPDETAAVVVPAEDYIWWTYRGARAMTLSSAGGKRTSRLASGDRFGVRESARNGLCVVVTESTGLGSLFSITYRQADLIEAKSKRYRGKPKFEIKPVAKPAAVAPKKAAAKPAAVAPAAPKPNMIAVGPGTKFLWKGENYMVTGRVMVRGQPSGDKWESRSGNGLRTILGEEKIRAAIEAERKSLPRFQGKTPPELKAELTALLTDPRMVSLYRQWSREGKPPLSGYISQFNALVSDTGWTAKKPADSGFGFYMAHGKMPGALYLLKTEKKAADLINFAWERVS